MKVMTYNIHHGEGLDEVLSLERIARVIQLSGATIIGLQEVDRYYGERSKFQDQAKKLSELLGYHYVYGANIDLPPVKGNDNQQYGNAILSKYPIEEWVNISLTSYETEPRGIMKATIDVNGTTLLVFNTHLSLDEESKEVQVEEIIEIVSKYAGPKVLLGDFNAEPQTKFIQSLLSQTDLTDCFVDVEKNFTYPTNEPNCRIDYIFASQELSFSNQQVLKREGSDHLPLIVDIGLK